MKPVAVPTLAEVVARPDCASGLPPTALSVLIAQTGSIQAQLAVELAVQLHEQKGTPDMPEATKWIPVAEAAAIAKLSPRWFYARVGRFRFIKRLSRKNIRVDEAAFRKWLEAHGD